MIPPLGENRGAGRANLDEIHGSEGLSHHRSRGKQEAVGPTRHLSVSSHTRKLLEELVVEVARASGVSLLFLASYLVLRTPDKDDAQAGNKNMATAVMIAPMFSSVITDSLCSIGRKTALLVFPFLVTPGIKRAAEYRKQFEMNKKFYSPSMQGFLDGHITRYTYHLEYHNLDLKEMATAIEEVLRFPIAPKRLERRNPKVREILQEYSPSVKAQLARVVSEICSHSHLEAPIKRITPIMLVGPPGTGKTFFVKQLAAALDLPLCEIKIAGYKSVYGKLFWSSDPEMGVVVDALLKSNLEVPENPPANVILFIDELDKALIIKEKQSELNTFLHTILETGTTEFPLARYCNAVHSIRHIIVILGANRSFSDVLGDADAEALESRIRTIDFSEGFDLDRKTTIVSKCIEDANREHGSDLILPEDETIRRILKKDEELKLKGVRILLEVVGQYIQSIVDREEIAYFLNREPTSFDVGFDVNMAYAKYLPKGEKEPPSRIPFLHLHV